MIPTILYIDDEELNILVFERSFRKKFLIRSAKSGEEGLEILNAYPEIDAVITDMKMPGMNGLEFISVAKKEYPDIPCFMLSGYNITPEIKEALNQELILKYFTKPLKNLEIECAINACLDK